MDCQKRYFNTSFNTFQQEGTYQVNVSGLNFSYIFYKIKVARYSFSGSIPPTFERKLRRHKQRFGKIDTTVVLDKDENLL